MLWQLKVRSTDLDHFLYVAFGETVENNSDDIASGEKNKLLFIMALFKQAD